MSVKAMTWAWSKAPDAGNGLLMLVAIADAADDAGICYLGVDALVVKTAVGRSTAIRHLNELEAAGLLQRCRRTRRDGSRTSNWLVLAIDLERAGERFEQMVGDGALRANPLASDEHGLCLDLGLSQGLDLGPCNVPNRDGLSPDLGPLVRPPTGDSLEPSVEPCPAKAVHAASVMPIDDREGVLCDRLAELMLANDPKARVGPGTTAWREPMRKLLDLDGRSVDEVEAVIAFCQADDFERANVLSPAKLRKRFGELLMKSQRSTGRTRRADIDRLERNRQRHVANAGTCCLGPEIGPSQAEEDWRALAAGLRREVGESNFDIWCSTAHAHIGAEDELLVGVDERVTGWVRDRFGPVLERLADRRVEVVVCDRGGVG